MSAAVDVDVAVASAAAVMAHNRPEH